MEEDPKKEVQKKGEDVGRPLDDGLLDEPKECEAIVPEVEEQAKMSLNDLAPSGNPLSVVMHCKPEYVDKLTSLGYSLVASEKALYYSSDHTVEKAIHYLELHELDENVDEPIKPKAPSNMSPEEKEKKAVQLQNRLRETIRNREKLEAQEKARERMKSSKAAHESMAAIEAAERQRQLMAMQKEKELTERLTLELRQKQIDDYRDRFGEMV
eukprot:GHVH01005780.1.p1 GENE.GHVH01005780.1~~GHVH01005780.1.p1  ORF type:complete len:212 (+),score=50.62 GHVH01005780.1:36-671(+)